MTQENMKKKSLLTGMFSSGRDEERSDSIAVEEEDRIHQISVSLISPDPQQPRKNIEEDEGLRKSIEKNGILQPIRLRKISPLQYQIVFGERRFRAAKELGKTTVPCIVESLAEGETDRSKLVQLVENIQRMDLTGFEQARSFKDICHSMGITQKELAEELGVPPSTISKTIKILDLPEEILGELEALPKEKQPSLSVLSELARKAQEEQMGLWESIRQGGTLTVADMNRAKHKGGRPKGKIADEFNVDSLVDGIRKIFRREQGKEEIVRIIGRQRLKKILALVEEA